MSGGDDDQWAPSDDSTHQRGEPAEWSRHWTGPVDSPREWAGPAGEWAELAADWAQPAGEPHRWADPVGLSPEPRASAPVRHSWSALIVAAAGVMAFVGSFLTWVTLTTPLGDVSVAGTGPGRDGHLTLVFGLLLVGAGGWLLAARPPQWLWVVALFIAGLILLVGVVDIVDVIRRGQGLESSILADETGRAFGGVFYGDSFGLEAGIGLYLQVIAGVAGIAAAVASRRERAGDAP